MTTYYKVLRLVEPADLNISPRIVWVLRMIPPDGCITFEHFTNADKNLVGSGIRHACSNGILKRSHHTSVY